MNFRETLLDMIANFFMITGGSLLGAAVFCTLDGPDDIYTYTFLWEILGFSAIATLPMLLLYSRHELTKKQMRRRMLLHFIVTLVVLVAAAFALGWIDSFVQALLMALVVIAVYAIMTVMKFHEENMSAKAMNQKLDEMRKE